MSNPEKRLKTAFVSPNVGRPTALNRRARFRTLPEVLAPSPVPVNSAQTDPRAPLAATNPPAFKRLRRPIGLRSSSKLSIPSVED
jgi:hypothetical protein